MRQHIFYSLLITGILFGFSFASYGQEKSVEITINSQVVDESGSPIENAKITIVENAIQTTTDDQGKFSIKGTAGDNLLVQAQGYEDLILTVGPDSIGGRLVMEKRLLLPSSDEAMINLPATIETTQKQLVGAVSKIDGEELESQPELMFSNALQGRLTGLTVRMNSGGLGSDSPNLYVRGLGRESNNGILTLVDGIERPIDFLAAEEIESVEVLKDASTKILYGPRAANGVILITTKRGKSNNTKELNASAEYGMSMSIRMPEYLNSAEYATLYNEARTNDGLSPFYSETEIAGYQNSTGANDLYYPNADYVDYFLKSASPVRKATIDYSGGTEDIQYALIAGYIGSEGLENVGSSAKYDRVNVRGNININLSSSIDAFIGGNGVIESRKLNKLWPSDIFNAISSHRPNEYPFVIDDPSLEGENEELGQEAIPPLGGSYKYPNSLYGDLVYGGFKENRNLYGQTNFGLNIQLDKWLEGLSAKSTVAFDTYQRHQAGQNNTPVTYERVLTDEQSGEEPISYIQLQTRQESGSRSEQGENLDFNFGWTANLNYERAFGQNRLSGTISHSYYLDNASNRRQDFKNTNTFLRTTYSFRDKIFLEATGAYMGSNKFSSENRYQFFPALGMGWVVSEEPFMKTVSSINFLKLKASFGILGYDRVTTFYLYDTRYFDNGNVSFNERNQNNVPRTGFDNFGNPDLEWEKSREINVGVEGLAFNNSLSFEFNYFDEYRSDIIFNNPGAIYSSLRGGLYRPLNLGEVSNHGIEGRIDWKKNVGNFDYSFGGNFLYTKNRVEKTNEVMYPDEYQRHTGLPTDAMFGYVDNGLFTNNDEIDNAPYQALGPYGVGSVAYQDLNNDNIVDQRDQRMIGNSFPRVTLGLNVEVKYKGFGLFLLGTAELGADVMKNNSYYWNSGEDKYSTFVEDRFHPENNPEGSVPALTTTNATNDFRGSTFWIEDASFFRLKNAELSYRFGNPSWTAKSIRFYVRGTNLFVLSKISELDPEVLNAGVSNNPVFRTITSGVAIGF